MTDLYYGLVCIGALAIVLFLGSLWCSYHVGRITSDLAAVIVVVLMFFYIRHLWYDVSLAAMLPYSNLIVVGNWFPLAAGLLGGFAWTRIAGRLVRKTICTASLALAAGYASVSPILGDVPRCGDEWDRDGVCIQTTPNTCTAASAATLLRWHGIEATEAEMAELCLTRKGTTWMGLYRGLKRKTEGTRWDVEVIECEPEQLPRTFPHPMILSVGWSDEETPNVESPRFAEWGWRPGQGHSVVLLGTAPWGGVKVADPTPGYGVEIWNRGELMQLFRGTAVRLIERT